MSKDTTKQLEFLPRLTRAELRALWSECFGHPLPSRVHKDFVVRCLAYRIQEQAHSALGTATRKRLRKLAEEIGNNGAPASLGARHIKPGTRLIREWRGETHTVTTTEKGFAYRGQRYKSLSEIACRITGTRWSGPLFFGLKVGHANN